MSADMAAALSPAEFDFLAKMGRHFGDPPGGDPAAFMADLREDLGQVSGAEWQRLPSAIRRRHKTRRWPANAVIVEALAQLRAQNPARAAGRGGAAGWDQIRQAWRRVARAAGEDYAASGAWADIAAAEGWVEDLRRHAETRAFELIRARLRQAGPVPAAEKLALIEGFSAADIDIGEDRFIRHYRARARRAAGEGCDG